MIGKIQMVQINISRWKKSSGTELEKDRHPGDRIGIKEAIQLTTLLPVWEQIHSIGRESRTSDPHRSIAQEDGIYK